MRIRSLVCTVPMIMTGCFQEPESAIPHATWETVESEDPSSGPTEEPSIDLDPTSSSSSTGTSGETSSSSADDDVDWAATKELLSKLSPDDDSDPDQEFRHPLMGVKAHADGQIPAVDIHDSPGGYRYAILETNTDAGDGYEDKEGGVVKLERSRFRPAKDEEPQRKAVVSPELMEEMDRRLAAYSNALMKMVVRVKAPQSSFLRTQMTQDLVEAAIARGEVKTLGDYKRVGDEVRDRIAAQVAEDIEPALYVMRRAYGYAAEADAGITVPKYSHTIVMNAPASYIQSSLDELSVLADSIQYEEEFLEQEEHVVYPTKVILAEHTDAKYGFDYGYDGDASGSSVTVGMAEHNQYPTLHWGFYESGDHDRSRIRSYGRCINGAPCITNYGVGGTEVSTHTAKTSGILVGDAMDGQFDQGLSTASRRLRSSDAPEVKVHFMHLELNTANSGNAWDWFYDTSSRPELINMSSSVSSSSDPGKYCDGEESIDGLVDEGLFERSMLLITSSGNKGHDNDGNCPSQNNDDDDGNDIGDSCVMGAPATATSALSIAGDASASWFFDQCDIEDHAYYGCNSRGGNGSRSIVDLAAPVRVRGYYKIALAQNYNAYTSSSSSSGTSISSPFAAGVAAGFIDMYRTRQSSSIDSPGRLKAWMLLMGNRYHQDAPLGGVKQDNESDDVSGFGAIRDIEFFSSFSDAPARWLSGSVCVGDGENVDIPLGINVDVFMSVKAVSWTYSKDFHVDGRVQDVDLKIRSTGGTLKGDYSNDTKKMAFFKRRDSREPDYVRLVGSDVTTDASSTCGSNSVKTYYAIEVRDNGVGGSGGGGGQDPEGPHYSADCIGIQNEHG